MQADVRSEYWFLDQGTQRSRPHLKPLGYNLVLFIRAWHYPFTYISLFGPSNQVLLPFFYEKIFKPICNTKWFII